MAPLLEAFSEMLGSMVSGAGSARRFWLCAIPTAVVIGLICAMTHNESAQLLLCVPIGLLGIGGGLYWQFRAE